MFDSYNKTNHETAPSHAHYFEILVITEKTVVLTKGFTFPVNGGSEDNHVHTFQGRFFMGRNTENFYGVTGPPIALENGKHYHMVSGISPIIGSRHYYQGRTDEGVGYFDFWYWKEGKHAGRY